MAFLASLPECRAPYSGPQKPLWHSMAVLSPRLRWIRDRLAEEQTSGDDDWVFASHRSRGLKPYWPHMILRRHVQPSARSLGINKTIGWHTFRRTFASLLKANGEDVKVVQELCGHANPNTTMGLYVQAFTEDARRAQGKVVAMVRSAAFPATVAHPEGADLVNVR